jgi:outer membrane protein OmpA-like peptidoglycan-associated protein
MRNGGSTCASLALLALAACGQSAPPADVAKDSTESIPNRAADAPGVGPSAASPTEASDADVTDLADALGLGGGGRPLPDGLLPGGDCPEVGADADAEIAAQASARVPLKVGLTLTELWKPNPETEIECLNQVTEIRRDSIDATMDCNHPRVRRFVNRRICRADLATAPVLMTETGTLTIIDASGQNVPETIVGATSVTLSRKQFAELERNGSVRHHYVELDPSGERLDAEVTAVLRREGAETARVAVNDSLIEIPVIRASGEAMLWRSGRAEKGRVSALIMDDEQFPLLVEYTHWTESSGQPVFRLSFVKVSYPGGGPDGKRGKAAGSGELKGEGEMERRLAEDKRVDVYGIYFDFNSERIRRESAPILQEIADVLGRNPDWTLSIDGHTDNVGGDAYNLDLSRRRTEAVRKALVDRYGVAATRLTTAGHGAHAPKDTNETPEGRARNRRVELVRQ